MKLVVTFATAAVFAWASAQTQHSTVHHVSYQYEVGQELGFGSANRVEEAEDESYVTAEVLDRLRRESSAGKKDAQYYLGVIHYYGDGVPKDVPVAVKFFTKAAEQGHLNAMVNLGMILSGNDDKNHTVPVDVTGGVRWLSRAVSYGDANAQWMLGKLHYDRLLSSAPDLAEAFRLFQLSAQQGNANGEFYMGLLTEYGYATPKSYAKAAKWYTQAAEQNHPEALYNLGLMYAYDRGVGKDYTQAALLFEKSCKMFHGPSCLFLATMNLYGTGFAIDYEAALMWMKQAENTRDSRVLEVAQKGVKELTALLDKAEDYFKKAEEKRPPPGRLNYVHIPKTKEEAERAHKIAHAVGDAQARARVKREGPPQATSSDEL